MIMTWGAIGSRSSSASPCLLERERLRQVSMAWSMDGSKNEFGMVQAFRGTKDMGEDGTAEKGLCDQFSSLFYLSFFLISNCVEGGGFNGWPW